MSYIKLILILLCFKINKIKLDESFNMDLNDFLDENLMPGNLLLLEGPFTNQTKDNLKIESRENDENDVDDGTFGTAFSTMGFHRKMINEYLCTNFIAEQILIDETLPSSNKIQRRFGSALDIVDHLDKIDESRSIDKLDKIKENMLYDQGSSGYKNWLEKTTTLEDIYRHYSVKPQQSEIMNKTTDNNRRALQMDDRQEVTEDDYEEGEIEGYAFHQPNHHVSTKQKLIKDNW